MTSDAEPPGSQRTTVGRNRSREEQEHQHQPAFDSGSFATSVPCEKRSRPEWTRRELLPARLFRGEPRIPWLRSRTATPYSHDYCG
jgi:hypothetical protein